MNVRQRQNRNRRLMQMIFGSQLFSFFSTYNLRIWAYRKCYDIGERVRIMEGVVFSRKHAIEGKLTIGQDVLLGRNVYIDYTGPVTVGDRVELSGGAMIISHSHDVLDKQSKKIELAPLHIADDAWICVNALIMPGVGYVGKKSVVSPGSVVYKRVPDYAIVRGNPAKIVAVVPPEIRNRRKTREM
jgi:acetyltransferase-like isoleucine patch superfamily enzyme